MAREAADPSATLDHVLHDGETVRWHAKPKVPAVWASNAVGAAIMLLFALFAVMLPFIAFGAMWFGQGLGSPFTQAILVGVPLLVIGYFALAAVQYPRHGEFVATDDRLIQFSGIVGRDVSTVKWEDVRNVEVDVGFVDRVFGTGSIRFTVAGVGGSAEGPGVQFRHVETPYEALRRLEEIMADEGTTPNLD